MKKRVFLISLLIIALANKAVYAGAIKSLKGKGIDYASTLDIREGDFVFQHLPGRLLRVIADVTDSQYSHCGIIVVRNGNYHVLEAVGPVKETSLNNWIRRGVGGRVTIVRLKEQFRSKIPNIIREAHRYLNKPYDIQYEWDDEKIYCSELLYKATKKGSGIKLAEFAELGELNWVPHEKFIRYITGGELPLNRLMITPEDLTKSEYVDTVYSSFPPRRDLKNIAYGLSDMEGEWKGDYTFPGNQLIQVNVVINKKGQIQEGQLAPNIYIYPSKIRKYNKRSGNFSYVLLDNNGTKTTIKGRMDPTKDGIYGNWKDSRGYKGVFSLSKKNSEDDFIENEVEDLESKSEEYEVNIMSRQNSRVDNWYQPQEYKPLVGREFNVTPANNQFGKPDDYIWVEVDEHPEPVKNNSQYNKGSSLNKKSSGWSSWSR